MRTTIALALIAAATLPPAARAGDVHAELDFDAYSSIFNVARVDADVNLDGNGYGLQVHYYTTGLYGALVSGNQLLTARGTWTRDGVQPEAFRADGVARGRKRHVVIGYAGATPVVQALDTSDDREREPVPPALTMHTEDTLSAMALLVRHLAVTGRCDGNTTIFDGRRVIALTARMAGTQQLAPVHGSAYAGPALRCDFEGRQIAGFLRDQDRHAGPKRASAWLASIVPGGPALPVRVAFDSPWFGEVTLYLIRVTPKTTVAHSGTGQ